MRLATILGLFLIGILLPNGAAAFWLPDGQCADMEAFALSSDDEAVSASEGNCTTGLDPTDPSYNACFELAEHPISTLPELIAQTQAERVVAALLDKSRSVTVVNVIVPSPNEASVEDPAIPGRQLVEMSIPRPRPRPNSCAVYPDDCETAPTIPTLNLEVSVPHADMTSIPFDVPPAVLPETRRGPPSPGVGPSTGILVRLDRPPQVG